MPGAGDPPEVPAEVEPIRARRSSGAPRAPDRRAGAPRPRSSSSIASNSAMCSNGATSRWPDEYGNCSGARRRARRGGRRGCSSTSPAASAQSGQPVQLVRLDWTYSRRQGAHSGFGIDGFSQVRSTPADYGAVSSTAARPACRRSRTTTRPCWRASRASRTAWLPRSRAGLERGGGAGARRDRSGPALAVLDAADAGPQRQRTSSAGVVRTTPQCCRASSIRASRDGRSPERGARRRRAGLRPQGRARSMSLVRALDVRRRRRHVHRPGARGRADRAVVVREVSP